MNTQNPVAATCLRMLNHDGYMFIIGTFKSDTMEYVVIDTSYKNGKDTKHTSYSVNQYLLDDEQKIDINILFEQVYWLFANKRYNKELLFEPYMTLDVSNARTVAATRITEVHVNKEYYLMECALMIRS